MVEFKKVECPNELISVAPYSNTIACVQIGDKVFSLELNPISNHLELCTLRTCIEIISIKELQDEIKYMREVMRV